MNTKQDGNVSIVLMVLLLFTTQACTDIFLPGLPSMALEFGATLNATNQMISVYSYSQAFVVLWIGVLSDLRGRRSTLLTCFLLHILATIWISYSSSLAIIIVLRAVQALGSAAVYIILRLIIKDTMDKKSQIHATGLLVVGLVLSPILAPVVGSWIIKLTSWRGCFWAIALLESALFVWAWVTIKETNHNQVQFRASFSLQKHFSNYWGVLQDQFFRGQALVVGSAFAAFYAFISISSYIYITQYGIAETSYSYVFILIAISYLVGNRFMSILNAKNILPIRIIGRGVFVSIVGSAFILAVLLTKNIILSVLLTTIGTCLLRLATALINPPAQVVVTNHFHERGSHALGLLTCIQYSFAAIGTMVVSGLPFSPSNNFIVSTNIFVALSVVGFLLTLHNIRKESNIAAK